MKELMSQHLTTIQITRLLERQADSGELEFIAEHAAACTECRERLNVARHTSERVAYLRETLTMDEATPAIAPAESGRRNLSTIIRQWKLWRPLPLTAAICALLLFGAGLFWWRNPRPTALVTISPTTPERTVIPSSLTPPPSVTATPVTILAELNDNGQRVTLDDAGQLSGLPALSPAHEQSIRQTLAKQRVPLPAELASSKNKVGTLLGDHDSQPRLTLLRPLGTYVIEQRPRLCWQAVTGALRYSVKILNTDFNLVTSSESITETCWQPPQLLSRNRSYVWQVTAETAQATITSTSAELTEARFKIISADQARDIEQAAHRYSSSHLALGTLYAQAGLLNEAAREFRLLLKANPQSAIARKLLTQVTQASR